MRTRGGSPSPGNASSPRAAGGGPPPPPMTPPAPEAAPSAAKKLHSYSKHGPHQRRPPPPPAPPPQHPSPRPPSRHAESIRTPGHSQLPPSPPQRRLQGEGEDPSGHWEEKLGSCSPMSPRYGPVAPQVPSTAQWPPSLHTASPGCQHGAGSRPCLCPRGWAAAGGLWPHTPRQDPGPPGSAADLLRDLE